MSLNSAHIKHEDVFLEVYYTYEPPESGDYFTPPSGGYIEIYEIHHKGENIIHILDDNVIEKLEKDLYEHKSSS